MNETKSVGVVRGSDGIVSNEEEEIDWLVIVDSIQKPFLLNHGSSLDNLRDIGVSSEVVEDAKGHDTKTLGIVNFDQ